MITNTKIKGRIIKNLNSIKVGDILYWKRIIEYDDTDDDYKTDIISLCFKINTSKEMKKEYHFKECYYNGNLIDIQKETDGVKVIFHSKNHKWDRWEVRKIINKKDKANYLKIILSSRL